MAERSRSPLVKERRRDEAAIAAETLKAFNDANDNGNLNTPEPRYEGTFRYSFSSAENDETEFTEGHSQTLTDENADGADDDWLADIGSLSGDSRQMNNQSR